MDAVKSAMNNTHACTRLALLVFFRENALSAGKVDRRRTRPGNLLCLLIFAVSRRLFICRSNERVLLLITELINQLLASQILYGRVTRGGDC